MGRIILMDFEQKVQVGDKTRFDLEKCFLTQDIVDPLTKLKVAPGEQTAIDIYDDDPKERFLDWVWPDFKFDIDATMNKIYFYEGGVLKTATIPVASYSLAALVSQIAVQMTAVAAQAIGTVLSELNELSILPATNPIKLKVRNLDASLLSILGFEFDSEQAEMSFQGKRIDSARRKVRVQMTTTATGPVDTDEFKDFYVQVLSENSDYLYSSDQDLIAEEPDIPKWTSKGRATFLNVHRKAQSHIVDWLDRNGYTDENGEKLDKWSIADREQVRLWSSYMALKFIFQSIKNEVDDVFDEKAEEYEGLEVVSRNRAVFKLALTKETKDKGKSDVELSPSSWSGRVYRR